MIQEVTLGAKLTLTAATLAYGLGPFITDMNQTHLTHPAWTGHARFHLLWASLSQLAVSTLALWLVWGPARSPARNCTLAAVIGLCMTSGFFGALLFKKSFNGTLHDPKGIPPLWGKVDGNLLAVLAIDALLIGGWVWLPPVGDSF
jgi:hypothetical protein